jgi:hypothetical protein
MWNNRNQQAIGTTTLDARGDGLHPTRGVDSRTSFDTLQAGLKQKWQSWVEKNVGGPEARVEIATKAAISALRQGKSSEEAAAAARQAASVWKELLVPLAAATPDPHGRLFRGRVAGMQQRQEMLSFFWVGRGQGAPYSLVWDFRLERNAPDGTPLPPMAIELRSPGHFFFRSTKGFEGSLLNGDQVEVDGRHYKPGRVLQVEQLRNLTSNSVVRIRGSSPSRVFAASASANTEKYSVIRGRVTTMQQRLDRPGGYVDGIMVWSFRLQQTQPAGRPAPLVEVEMRSRAFEGSIAVGDELEVDARGYRAGDIVRVKRVRNLSSNSMVRVR